MAPPLAQRLRIATRALAQVFDPSVGAQLPALIQGIYPHGGRGEPAPRGTREFLEMFSQSPWLRAAGDRVSEACAAPAWRLYRSTSRGRTTRNMKLQRALGPERRKALESLADSGNLEEVEEHPLLDVLEGGSGFLIGSTIRKLWFLHRDLAGTAFWMKVRGGIVTPQAPRGTVTSVLPVPPHWIAELPTPSRQSYRPAGRVWDDIPAEDMWMFTDPDPANPYGFGVGIAKALTHEIDTDDLAAKHTRSFFWNHAVPPVIVTGVGLTPASTAQLEASWMAKLQGYWNRGRPFFMNTDIKVQEVGNTLKEMDLVPLRQHERDVIHQVFGVPPELLGINQQANRSTSEAADYHMARYVTTPRLEWAREHLQARIVPEYDERLIIDYDNPIQEDKEFALKAMQAKPEVPSVDEWRTLMGLEPSEDEDEGAMHIVSGVVSAVAKLSDLVGANEPLPIPAGGEEEE